MSNVTFFWAELKRRRVIRVAAAYAAVGIAVGSAAELFLDNLGAPAWLLPTVLFLIILGLPVALVLAWAYERTPEGVVRDAGAAAVDEASGSASVTTTESAHRADPKAVAVLPFANMSDDAENEFFADGVAEDILMRLSQVAELHVISRTSAMVYKGTRKPISEIGRELGVGSILEGSVRRAGGRVRVVAQLIETTTDRHLWAETFDRDLADIFAVQSEIAEQIAKALHARLAPEQLSRFRRGPTLNLKAYELFLRGRSAALALRTENVAEGIDHLEAALRLDPGFAEAAAMLAWVHGAATYYATSEARQGFQRALELAEQALQMNPELPRALTARGFAKYQLYDWQAAEKDLRRAIELDPNSSDSQMMLGHFLILSSRFSEAAVVLDTARTLAPQEPLPSMHYSIATFFSGKQEEGLRAIQAAIDINPDYYETPMVRGWFLVERGQFDEGLEALEAGVTLSDRHPYQVGFLAVALTLAGQESRARQLAEEIDVEHPQAGRTGPAFAAVVRGDLDQAAGELESLAEARHPLVLWITKVPWVDRILEGNARYRALKQRIWPG